MNKNKIINKSNNIYIIGIFALLLLANSAMATKYINDNATGGDCTSIGIWNAATKTCTLTMNLSEQKIQIDSNGVTLDGNRHTTNGTGLVGISISGKNNITIKNLDVVRFWNGIEVTSSNNNNFKNNDFSFNPEGIHLVASNNNTIADNNFSKSNIILSSSNNNIVNRNNVSAPGNAGIDLFDSSTNSLTNNNALNSICGFGLDGTSFNNIVNGNNISYNSWGICSAGTNKIYNNIFNNGNNGYAQLFTNSWNTTKQSGINIIGGPYLGGNYWANPQGTGFSQTCSDVNTDGICDSKYLLDGNNIDYLPLAGVTVLSPNGGETWLRSTSNIIQWKSLASLGPFVRIDLLYNKSRVGTMTSNTSNDGSHSWFIWAGRSFGSYYKIRVSSINNPIYTDTSDNNFTIGGINIISPNGGENWTKGTTHNIKWSSLGNPGPYVRIQLLKNESVNGTVVSSTPNNGSYNWTIWPGRASAKDYKIRIVSTNNSYRDRSDGNFSIS